MTRVDGFCYLIQEIDNQTDAESLIFSTFPEFDVECDMFGFLCIARKGKSTKWSDFVVRIGMVKDKWLVISSPFADLVEKENSSVRKHIKRLLRGELRELGNK